MKYNNQIQKIQVFDECSGEWIDVHPFQVESGDIVRVLNPDNTELEIEINSKKCTAFVTTKGFQLQYSTVKNVFIMNIHDSTDYLTF